MSNKKKFWLGYLLLLIIAFVGAAIVSLLNLKQIYAVIGIGITLGIILELNLDLENLLFGFFSILVTVLTIILLLTPSFSTSIFESTTILISSGIYAVTATIFIQWLIRNWVCSCCGFSCGIITSASAICLGVTSSSLIFD